MKNKKINYIKKPLKYKSDYLRKKLMINTNISNSLQLLSKTISQQLNSFNIINDFNKQYNDYIVKMLEPLTQFKINLPTFDFTSGLFELLNEEYTGEKLNEKILSVRKWGDYGWVLYNELSVPEIFNLPESQTIADDMVLKVFDGQLMFSDLNKIKENAFIRNDYIDDIIFLYENNRFNSCVMVILNSIERIMLYHMKLDRDEFGLKFKINSKANQSSFSNINAYKELQLTYLNALNLIVLLEKTFKTYGFDWDSEPDFVARDYINHGMSDRKITRVDVIKLILLLIEFSDWSNTVIEKNRRKFEKSN